MRKIGFRTSFVSVSGLTALLAAALSVVGAETNETRTPPKPPEPPATYTITRGALTARVQLDAVLEAAEAHPLKLEPKAWTDLSVLEAAPHGARVRKGDPLVRLDAEKLREHIAELEQDRRTAALNLELAQAELTNLEQSTPARLEASRRTHRVAQEDLAYFEKTGRVQKETAARFNVKSAEQRLDNANEELRQLKKMYDADDLTEETEEIILKRQKFNVEASEYGLEQARQMAEVSLKTALPREHDTLKALARDQSFALELADQTLPRQLLRKRLEVDKLKRERGKSDKRLADLKNDLALLSVKAPADGVVYYGACENGRWTTGGALAKKLVPNGKLMPNEVFMTLVNPDKLVLKAVAAEAELAHLRPGLEGKATPVRAPDKPLRVRLDELEEVPLPSGGFQAVLSFRQEPGVLLLPGMNCKIVFEDLEKPSALLAPKEAVFGDGSERYVLVAGKDGKAEKRVVKVGEADAKRIEILEGLTEGSKILLKKPE